MDLQKQTKYLDKSKNTTPVRRPSDNFGKKNLIVSFKEDEKLTLLQLSASITFLNENINVARKMTPQQIVVASKLIIDEFYYLSLDDINLCFKYAVGGRYGSFYEGLDLPKISGWLKLFTEQRFNEAEDKSQDYKAKHEPEENIHFLYEKFVRDEEKVKDFTYEKQEAKFKPQKDTDPFRCFVDNNEKSVKYLQGHYKKRMEFALKLGLENYYFYYEKCYQYCKFKSNNYV